MDEFNVARRSDVGIPNVARRSVVGMRLYSKLGSPKFLHYKLLQLLDHKIRSYASNRSL